MSKKVRIELRFDEVKDKEMINFIDEYGSTRAGFIKQVLKMYKNQVDETNSPKFTAYQQSNTVEKNPDNNNTERKKRKPSSINDISFSSKDLYE